MSEQVNPELPPNLLFDDVQIDIKIQPTSIGNLGVIQFQFLSSIPGMPTVPVMNLLMDKNTLRNFQNLILRQTQELINHPQITRGLNGSPLIGQRLDFTPEGSGESKNPPELEVSGGDESVRPSNEYNLDHEPRADKLDEDGSGNESNDGGTGRFN